LVAQKLLGQDDPIEYEKGRLWVLALAVEHVVMNMLLLGMPKTVIAVIAGISEDDVKKVADKIFRPVS
jgi:hypothetical protein